jgi:hypothetical protein
VSLKRAVWHGPYALALVASLLTVQVTLTLQPEAGLPSALRAGLAVLVSATLLLLIGDLIRRLIFARAVPPTTAAWPFTVNQIALAGALLLIAVLPRAPQRLVVNLLGYALVAVPLLWLTRRHAGENAARLAALALTLFAVVPTHLKDVPVPSLPQAEAGSNFRWPAGWLHQDWVLRHRIVLAEPLPGAGSLRLSLAAPYSGPAEVIGRLNGQTIGPFRPVPTDLLEASIPAALLRGPTDLTIELRLSRPDPALSVAAQRWTGAATLRDDASSYFDGRAWHGGTFDTVAIRAQRGAYVLELIPR